MELVKKHIRTNCIKGKAGTQITLDDDFNVPDVKPDIDQIIEETGKINIVDVKTMADKVLVRGCLEFCILYVSTYSDRPLHNMSGCIHFEETVNMDGISEDDEVKVSWDMEDLRTSLINSRKLSVRSIASLTLMASKICNEETAVELEEDENTCVLNRGLDVSQIHSHKKDIFRVKEELVIPGNKPNILEVLWNDIALDNIDVKLVDDHINLRGEVGVFTLYAGEEENNPLQYLNSNVGFNGSVDCSGVREEMIGNINVTIGQYELEVKEDADGEKRGLSLELVLELDISVYEEEHIDIITDIYSTKKQLVPVTKKTIFDNILLKNRSNCKLNQKIQTKNDQSKILQICNTNGNIKIDRTEVIDDGILVEGVVYVQILYIAADDKVPMNALKGMVPFSHIVEVDGVTEYSTYEITPFLEQISTTMLDSEEIEVKATLSLNTMVFTREEVDIIIDVETEELDLEELEKMPNIIGYMVKKGDTLWDLAKRFHTTIEALMELNELVDEEIIPNQRLVVIKCCEIF